MIKKLISYAVCIIWLVGVASWLVAARWTASGAGGDRQSAEAEWTQITETSGWQGLTAISPFNRMPTTGTEPQSNSPDQPVEQVRKNIQVLKGLPASQLFPVMNFVSASLGVRCNYCHVNQGDDSWVWESDDKETKRTARRMMQMVINLNKNNQADFRSSGVTCYTCHRGQTEPQRLPTLPLIASEGEAGSAARESKPKEPLPTVDQVLNRYVEAVGGKAAAAKLKTRVMRGTREASQNRIWGLEVNVKQPDKFLIAITVPQQGMIYQGFNGMSGWLKTPREQRIPNAAELIALEQTAELYEGIKVKAPTSKMTMTGREKIAGREVYVLGSAPDDGTIEKLYFDVQTGLLLRKLTLTSTVLVPIPEQIDFEDYREVDGVKLPFTIRISNIDNYFSSTRKFTEIRHNVSLDDAIFEMPAVNK